MARNDGIDRTVARNQDLETPADVAKVQEHNEREKDSYSNQDIVPERTALNVHFKSPTDDYRGTSDCDPVQGAGRTAALGSCDRAGGTGEAGVGECQSCHGETEKETGSSAKGNQNSKDRCSDGAGD